MKFDYYFMKKVNGDDTIMANLQIKGIADDLYKKIKELAGLNLAMVAFVAGTLSQPISALTAPVAHEKPIYAVEKVEVTTKRAVNRPLGTFQVSQGYHFFHRAIDLKEPFGSSVYAIGGGKVKEVIYSHFGYGNHVIVAHSLGLESLYAHFGRVFVEKGDEVDENTILGEIGMTGWTTGPHLHLEITKDGRALNPIELLK